MELFGTIGKMEEKGFIAGTDELRDMNVTFAKGTKLTAGTVVAKDASTGNYKAATDNTASAILAVDVNAADGDAVAPVYIKGAFIAEKCNGYVEDAMQDALRALNIYMVHEH